MLYLFASTSSSAGLNDDSVDALRRIFGPNTLALNVGESGQCWSNGIVLGLHSADSVNRWKPWLLDELKGLVEFWLLHDGRGRAVDNMSDGPGTMALEKLGSKSICQLFLRFDHSDRFKADRVSNLMQEFEERRVNCRYAFGFNNGGAHFLTSLQASQTIFRRCEGALRHSIEYTFIDARGVCYGPHGEMDEEKAWTTLRPPQKLFQLFGGGR